MCEKPLIICQTIMFADSHAHLTSDALYADLDNILARAKSAKVDLILNICTDPPTLERGLKLKEKFPWVHQTGATTPHDVEADGDLYFEIFATAARTKKLVAIGETGLDYYYERANRELQKDFLIRFARLAEECNLPLIIHCREAFQDLFAILDPFYKGPLLLHCFTGTLAEAEEVLKRGWYLSLSGIVTFKNAIELRKVAQIVPLDHLLIETDAPYLAPHPNRGKVNEPAYLPYTAEVIAREKQISVENLAKATKENVKNLFKL